MENKTGKAKSNFLTHLPWKFFLQKCLNGSLISQHFALVENCERISYQIVISPCCMTCMPVDMISVDAKESAKRAKTNTYSSKLFIYIRNIAVRFERYIPKNILQKEMLPGLQLDCMRVLKYFYGTVLAPSSSCYCHERRKKEGSGQS